LKEDAVDRTPWIIVWKRLWTFCKTEYRMKDDTRTKYRIVEPGLEAGIYVKRERISSIVS
jgi:hypothetical protein